MKVFKTIIFCLSALSILFTVNQSALAQCSGNSVTFNYTGASQSYIVPNGVDSIRVVLSGAQGGSSFAGNTNYGGQVSATINVTPGETIEVYVGGQATSLSGGFNGGGNGESGGIGGGGASDIRQGGNTLAERVLVAGGAGGGGFWSGLEVIGGLGGGLVGGDGYRNIPTTPGGGGGTQTTSANGTCRTLNNPSNAGGFGFGGSASGCGCDGYGGGGGWYGGGAGGNCRGGGGGSGFASPSAVDVEMLSGVQIGNGEIVICEINGNAIPTMSEWGLILLSLVFLSLATVTLRSRKRALA